MKMSIAILLVVLMLLPVAASAKQHPGITCELSARSRLIEQGASTIITWRSSGAILFYGPGGTPIAPYGSMTVSPTHRTIYKFKFVGIGGNRTCGIRIRIAGEVVPE